MGILTGLVLVIFIQSAISRESKILERRCHSRCASTTFTLTEEAGGCMSGCKIFSKLSVSSADANSAIITQSPRIINQCYSKCNDLMPVGKVRHACKFGCSAADNLAMHQDMEMEFENMRHFALAKLHPILQLMQSLMSNQQNDRIIEKASKTFILRNNDDIISIRLPLIEDRLSALPDNAVSSKHENDDAESDSSHFKTFWTRAKEYTERVTVQCRKPALLFPLFSFAVGVMCFLLVILFSKGDKKRKMKNINMNRTISIPASALPSKLVRPEDLTKLSLIDDDDLQIQTSLPAKVKLPDHAIV